jgi:hypothetical protein
MKTIFKLFFTALIFCSCDRTADKVPVPAYVYVSDIIFQQGNPTREGSASHKISDAWISVDGQLIGTNILPTLLPVILNDSIDNHQITIRAGIIKNGVASTRTDYLVFKRYNEFRILEPGKIDTFIATVGYDTSAIVEKIEDFEGVGVAFGEDLDGNSNTAMTRQQEDVFEGNYSGKLFVDSGNLECQLATTNRYYNLQQQGTAFAVYLEMNYKTEVPIQIGLRAHYANGQTETHFKGGVRAVNYWNKVYFDFSQDIFTLNAESYSLIFLVQNADRLAAPKIYIDNLKFVHY